MPHRVYKHHCTATEDGMPRTPGAKICPDCRKKGKPDGWDFSTTEKMCAFRVVTGLPSMGPHYMHLPKLRRSCDNCGGRGMLDVDNHRGYRFCSECGGLGSILILSDEEMEKVRIKAERRCQKEEPSMPPVKFDKPRRSWVTEAQLRRVYCPEPIDQRKLEKAWAQFEAKEKERRKKYRERAKLRRSDAK